MRVPRKIKKAAKYVERYERHTTSGLLVSLIANLL